MMQNMMRISAVIFMVFLNTRTILAQLDNGFFVSNKCSYLERQKGQGNAYRTKDGVECCLCGKGHFWEGDCTGSEFPYTTNCTICQHDETVKTYIDVEPHKMDRCQVDRCPHPFISVGGSPSEKSRCVCPEGYVEKKLLKPYCEKVNDKKADIDTKVELATTKAIDKNVVIPRTESVTAPTEMNTPNPLKEPDNDADQTKVTENPIDLATTGQDKSVYTASSKFNKDTFGTTVPPKDAQGSDQLLHVIIVIVVFFGLVFIFVIVACVCKKKYRRVCKRIFPCCSSSTEEAVVAYTSDQLDQERGDTATFLNSENCNADVNVAVPEDSGVYDSGVDNSFSSISNPGETVDLLCDGGEGDVGASPQTNAEHHCDVGEDTDTAPDVPKTTEFLKVEETAEVQKVMAGPIRYDNDDRSRERREPTDISGNGLQDAPQNSDQPQPGVNLQRPAQQGSQPSTSQMQLQNADPRLSPLQIEIRRKALRKISESIQISDLLRLSHWMISNDSDIDCIRRDYKDSGLQEEAWQLLRRGIQLHPELTLYNFREKVKEWGLGYLADVFEDHIKEYQRLNGQN